MPRLAPPIRVAPDLTTVLPRPAGPVTLGNALARWERYLNTSERVGSQRTIESYLKALDKLVDRLGSQYELHAISPDDVRGLLADAKERGLKPASRSAIYRPIRTFMRWAVREGLIPVAPTDRVDAPHVPDLRSSTSRTPSGRPCSRRAACRDLASPSGRAGTSRSC